VPFDLSRRALLLAPAALLPGCRRRRATGYPGYCFVAAQQSHSLGVIDLLTFRIARPVRLDAAPSVILPHPRLPRVLVLSADTGTIYEVDAASRRVTRRVRVATQAVGMVLADEPGRNAALWLLARAPAALVEIPLDSLQPRRRIRLPLAPDDFDVSANHAAIVSRSAAALMFVRLDRAAVERTVTLSRDAAVVRFQQKGAQVIAGSWADRSLSIIDAATAALLVRLPLPIEPHHFCSTEDGGQLFVSGPGMDAVVIVYPYQTEIGETILAGRAPAGMAIVGPYLLVTNPDTGMVTALDIETRRLAAVVAVGREPRHILITPDRQYALVLNEKSGDLAVIRIASLATRRYKSAPLFAMLPVGEKPVSAGVVSLA
jgi:DNA-binding beta-propeller fold protein YncE